MRKVSVYIPVYNGARYLEETLAAIFSQTYPFEEVVIVDDGSDPAIPERIGEYSVRIVRHEENHGLGFARNRGIKALSTEYIASVDADCVIAPDWVETCLAYFDDPEVVGVGGRLNESADGTVDEWRQVNLVQHFGSESKQVAFFSGSNTIFRKKALESVDCYDPLFRRNHEDVDLCERLSVKGGILMYAAQAHVTHMKRDTVYSVMRTCWGFRHRDYPETLVQLVVDLWKELLHCCSIVMKSIRGWRWSLMPLNCVYFFMQSYFSVKAWMFKTMDVR